MSKISRQELNDSVNEELNKISLLSDDLGGKESLSDKIKIGLTNESKEINVINAINYTFDNSSKVKIGDITNLVAIGDNSATQLTITWNNPVSTDLVKVEGYISTNDISNEDREYCINNAIKFVDNKIETATHNTTNNTLYYIKIFSVYNLLGNLQYSEGISISKLVKDETPPSMITSFIAEKGNALVTLSWINPIDSDFSKVKILYRTGNYPTSPTDGLVAYEGSGTTTTLTGLTNDETYYFRAFTYDVNNNINDSTVGSQVNATPKAYVIYGVKIDTTNSNPETAVTYTDMTIGFTPANGNNGAFTFGSWQDKFPFNQIKPCVFLNGAVNYYLNPNDYTKKLDGTTADITTGADGDVMIEFPKVYWKFETIGTDLYIRYSDAQVDSGYKCLGHVRGVSEKDKIYISAYIGNTISGKLRSLSGKTPTVNQTIGTFRTQAQANGSGYEQMVYYQLLMLQVLFIVMFKNRDSQSALGRGYVDGNSASTITGGTNNKGMFYGETTGKQQNKFCGIEDFWGNTYYWIDGLYSDVNRNILIGTNNFNDTGNGYTNYGQGSPSDLSGYIGKVQGGTETGFIVKDTSGSQTTYYCDYGYLYSSRLPIFGGSWGYASGAGAFLLNVSDSASDAGSSVSARLMSL